MFTINIIAEKERKTYRLCLLRCCLFSKCEAVSRTALLTIRLVNVSSVGAARARTHIPGDVSVIEHCPCASTFQSTANISIFFLCWIQRAEI